MSPVTDPTQPVPHEAKGRESPTADTWRRHTMVAPPFLVSPLVDLTSSILPATDPLVTVSPPAGGCESPRAGSLRRPIAEYCGPYRKQGARDMHHTKTAKGPTCKHIITYTHKETDAPPCMHTCVMLIAEHARKCIYVYCVSDRSYATNRSPKEEGVMRPEVMMSPGANGRQLEDT